MEQNLHLFEIIKHQHHALFQYLTETQNKGEKQNQLIAKLIESLESDLEMEGIKVLKPEFGDAVDTQSMKILSRSSPENDLDKPFYKISYSGKSLLYSIPNTVHSVHECGWLKESEETSEVAIVSKATVTIFGKSELDHREHVFNNPKSKTTIEGIQK
jgi:hypothetical protein